MIVEHESHSDRASDAEALRMVLAFYCIMDAEKRSEVVTLAERYAAQSTAVEGRTHFLLLDPEIAS